MMKYSKKIQYLFMSGIFLIIISIAMTVQWISPKVIKDPETLTEYAKQWCDSKSGTYDYTGVYGHECIVKLVKGRFNNGTEIYQIAGKIKDYDTGEIEVFFWPRGNYFDDQMRLRDGRNKSQVIGRFIHKGGDYWK